jgi:hypothetical protein
LQLACATSHRFGTVKSDKLSMMSGLPWGSEDTNSVNEMVLKLPFDAMRNDPFRSMANNRDTVCRRFEVTAQQSEATPIRASSHTKQSMPHR